MNQTFSVTGPTEKRWGQTYQQGNFFVVIEIEGDEELQEIGHDIIEAIEQFYYEQHPKSLKDLKQLSSQIDLPLNTALITGLVTQNSLYLVGNENACAYLNRDNMLALLLDKKGALTGPLKPNDQLFLLTPSCTSILDKKTLEEAIAKTPDDELEDELASILQNAPTADGAALLSITISEESEQPMVPEDEDAELEEDTEIENDEYNSKNADTSDHESNEPKQEQTNQAVISKPSAITRIKKSLAVGNILYSKKRKLTASIGLILTVLLVVSLVFGSEHKKRTLQRESYDEAIASIEEPLESAKSLLEFNPQDAYEELVQIEATVTEARDLFPEDSQEYQLLSTKLEEISVYLLESQRIYTISDPSVFFDLTWIKDEAEGTRMTMFEDTLIVIDPENQSSYSISLGAKDSEIEASGSELADVSDVAMHGTTTSYIISGSETKVLGKTLQEVIPQDEEWGDLIAASAYSGNLYLLDKSGFIWKYPAQNNTYGEKQSYLAENTEINFDRALDMAIDGAIWVLTESNILKFALGQPDAFFIQDEGLESPKAMFTNEDIDYLYILEDSRVLVLDKEGDYHQQYVWDSAVDVSDIIVYPEENKILLLSGNVLYALDIR